MSKKTSMICMGLAAFLCVAGITQICRMMTTENSVSAEEVTSVDEKPQDLTSHCIPDDYDLNYRIHGDTAEVYKMVYTMESPEEVVVADTYEGLPVTSIAEETFTEFALVKYFSLPDSIEKIGSLAFYKCNSLQEIDLPKNLKTIDEEAFLECKSLKTIYLYDNLESIGDACFDGIISLTDVYYSGTEEQWDAIKIGEENTDLEKATIHFNSTASTEADSVNVTEETQDLTSHCIPTVCDVDYRINGDTAEAYGMVVIVDSPKDREELPKEIVVADTWRDAPVTAIAEEAFLDVDFAESIVLPDSVETIGVCAFLGCTSLQEIHLPKSLKTIDAAAFLDCQSLKTLYLYDNLESIGEGCFDDSNTSLTDIYYSGTGEQWNAIEIGEGNTALEKATIHFNADSADPTEEATVRSYYDGNSDNNSLVSLNVTGDVNEDGTVDIVDVLALNQYLLGIASISDSGKISADVDSNNIINDTDSMNILKYLVNLIDSFDSLKAK